MITSAGCHRPLSAFAPLAGSAAFLAGLELLLLAAQARAAGDDFQFGVAAGEVTDRSAKLAPC